MSIAQIIDHNKGIFHQVLLRQRIHNGDTEYKFTFGKKRESPVFESKESAAQWLMANFEEFIEER